jgi:hypothetical protein
MRIEIDLTPEQAAVAVLPPAVGRGRAGARGVAVPAAGAAPAPVVTPAVVGNPGGSRRGGFTLTDDRGDAIIPSNMQTSFRRDVGGVVREIAIDFSLPAGRSAKLVYSGGKAVAVEIPFALRDIPLP